jgi:hypothetical protein
MEYSKACHDADDVNEVHEGKDEVIEPIPWYA